MDSTVIDKMKDIFARGIERATQAGASGMKANFSRGESISCHFSGGRLASTSTNRGMGYGVTVIIDGRMGSVGGNDIDAFDHILDKAIEMARMGSAVHFSEYPAPGDYVDVQTYCPRTEAITRQQLIDAGKAISKGLRAHSRKIHVESGGSRSVGQSLMLTSGGVCNERKTTSWGIHGGGQRTQGTDMLHFGAGRSWQQLNDMWDTQYIIDRAIRDLTLAKKIVPCPSGQLPLLLDPGVLGAFLSPGTQGINGRTVAMGGSPLADKLGEQILDPAITIIDDPHRDFDSPSTMDGDGVPTAQHTIVDKGVLKMFLYDLDTAAMVGAQPTGHNGCSMRGMEILPGEKTHEQLLASMDEGIYLKGMLGFGQGNIASGDFSANISPGYLVRKGEIVGRVKDTMIAGNLLELMKQNVQLSSDYDEPGRVPWALIQGVSVSSSAG